MPEFVPVKGDPFLEPVEHDPFAPEVANAGSVGPAADAVSRLGQYFAHRLMQRISGPAAAMQPVEPEKPGMWSDIDEVHRLAADDALTHWAGEAAFGTIRR